VKKSHSHKSGPSLLSILKPYKGLVVLLVILAAIANALALVVPKIISKGIDSYGTGTLDMTHLGIQFFVLSFFIPILLLGIVYNFNFIEEFNLGKINGYSPALVREAVSFIKSHKNIEKVLVYNDNGGYNIRQTGKYQRRFYADPKFSNQERVDYLNNNKIYYYVLDIPKIQKGSIYEKFLGSCKEEFSNRDGYINSIIYNCKDAKDVSL
jgi:ABC-type multidrug transport system fused ATPase/permease subunit